MVQLKIKCLLLELALHFLCYQLVEGVTIDGQLTVIKNDCFERQAIGHRLKASDIYKILELKTVAECQRECTLEEDTCKTFSFGIGPKGNASCELSKRVIRETADLKPIGTLLDEDFDLYIKKLGCKLVIEQKPTTESVQSDEIPSVGLGESSPGLKPKPQFDPPGYYGSPGKPPGGLYDKPPRKPYGNVQTSLISIRPDPSRPGFTGLSSNYINEPLNERPSYGGVSVSYVNEVSKPRPGPNGYGEPSYGPPHQRPPPHPIDNEIHYNRPHVLNSRPDFRPGVGYYRPIDPMMDEFRPHYDSLRPESWSGYEGPDPMRDPNTFGSYYGMDSGPSRPTNGYNDLPTPSYHRPPEYGPDQPMRPQRPQNSPRPEYDPRPGLGYYASEMEFSRPGRPQYEYGNVRPDYRPIEGPTRPRPTYDERPGYDRPSRPEYWAGYDRPVEGPSRPSRPSYGRPGPELGYDRPDYGADPGRPPMRLPMRPEYGPQSFDPKPGRPNNGYDEPVRPFRPNWDKDVINRPYDMNNPNVNYENVVKPVTEDNYGNRRQDIVPHRNGSKPIISEIIGPNGQKITSIITEIRPACFRRALAGKRVTRSLIRRALSCGRVEDCQQECQDEKRFVCEGFNYRLDPTGRGNGDCELLDLPMVRLDMIRDVYPDPDYDIYEKDRNGYPDCKGGGFGYGFGDRDRPYHGGDRDGYADRRYDALRPIYGDHHHRDRFDDRPNGYLPYGGGPRPGHLNGYGDEGHRHVGDYQPHHRGSSPPYLPTRPPPYLPNRKYDRGPENPWGLQGSSAWGSYGVHSSEGHRGQSVVSGNGIPSPYDVPVGDSYAPKPGYDLLPKQPSYLPNYGEGASSGVYGNAYGGSYGGVTYSTTRPTFGIVIPINSNHFGQPKPTYGEHPPTSGYDDHTGNVPITESNFPQTDGDTVEHKDNDHHSGYNFLKEECSLRTATGFRLHKIIVKKYYSVPDIYECETLCFKEKDFQCHSYAYRYTLTSTIPTDNCYLSERNYKELDFYTDLEPDRDFDIYTMNNRKKCEEQIPREKEHSDCFWHTRSGQRLDQKIVREATMVKNIVECQIACLRATKFLCRGFSFRYGSPVIGGPVENCLLTDWPFKEIDPNTQFASELGFEIYERGSFGHGCEPNHFSVRGKDHPVIGSKTDQLCYVGYGTPARLLPEATRKSTTVNSQLDCKQECTKYRHSSLFQCMSFSYRTKVSRGEPNCDLSDILQRDLLNSVDYVPDPDSWLYAWDNYNPECVAITGSKGHGTPSIPRFDPPGHYAPALHGYGSSSHHKNHGFHSEEGHHRGSLIPHHEGYHQNGNPPYLRHGIFGHDRYDGPISALDTWRVYSVSGWPCRRGSLCRENKEAGFWYCPLEGGDHDTWDYCCRPDHQCGYSEGYNYQWCYVGPVRTQWRKCSERYYPYIQHRHEPDDKPYLPSYNPSAHEAPPVYAEGFLPSGAPSRPPFRPNRPLPRPRIPPKMPSLNEYEQEFNTQFLDPPKPGGFGQPRYWPVSYLHRELPPDEGNDTEFKYDRMRDGRISAIHNLITIIKSNHLKDIRYEIDNDTNLLIQVPLPGNFSTSEGASANSSASGANDTMKTSMQAVDQSKSVLKTKGKLEEVRKNSTVDGAPSVGARVNKSDDLQSAPASGKSNVITRHVSSPSARSEHARSLSAGGLQISRHLSTQQLLAATRGRHDDAESPVAPSYRKSYIVRTNKTDRTLHFDD